VSTRAARGFLERMAATSHARAARVARGDVAGLVRRARARRAPPRLALAPRDFDLLAEVKFASPALGRLAPAPSAPAAAAQARRYAAGGAAALSVLTEPTRFRGALAHLAGVTGAVDVPALRKDFLVDPVQVVQARAAGAAGVLLVLRLVDEEGLARLLDAAGEHGLFALLEAFDSADLERAARALERFRGLALLVGVNARDLTTLAVERERHLVLARELPAGAPAVAESGLETPAQVAAVAAAGYRLALVGGALMRASAPEELAQELLLAGRAAAAGGHP